MNDIIKAIEDAQLKAEVADNGGEIHGEADF